MALQAEVAATVGILNASHARLVELTAEALAADLWCQAGVHTPVQWLVWQAGVAPAHARQVVKVASRVAELPAMACAVQTGELSLDQAAVVAQHCPAGFDRDVVTVAVNATVPQLHRILGRYRFAEPEPDAGAEPEPDRTAHRDETRRLSFGGGDDGNWHLNATLPADEGAVIEAALAAKRDELFRRENPDVEPGTPEWRAAQRELSWADAAVALAADSLAAGEAQYNGSVVDRFRAVVHFEADPRRPDGPPVAGLHLGAALPASLRRYLFCDGDVLPVWERKGTPVALGRSQRVVPPKVRLLVEHRDGGCRVPGCTRTRWLHIHHIIHWEDLGETEPENLICLCQRHHRLHHQGQLPITGTASDLTVRDRAGRELPAVGRPEPVPSSADLTTAAEQHELDPIDYQHPPGEKVQPRWIDFAHDSVRPERRAATSAGGDRAP